MDVSQMIKAVESRYGFEETVERIRKKVEELGWSVIEEKDFEEKLGLKFRVIEICNRDFALKALEKPENRWISAFMPCKFSIVENPDGVYIYCINMGAFAHMVQGELGELLEKVSQVDEEITSSIL